MPLSQATLQQHLLRAVFQGALLSVGASVGTTARYSQPGPMGMEKDRKALAGQIGRHFRKQKISDTSSSIVDAKKYVKVAANV